MAGDGLELVGSRLAVITLLAWPLLLLLSTPRIFGWERRHREAFAAWQPAPLRKSPFAPYFDPNAKLHADRTRLGGLPKGIPEGMPVHKAYAEQWESLSKTVGLDALMLRDSFGMPVPYQRRGPWGPVAPSPEVFRRATAGVAALVRELKTVI